MQLNWCLATVCLVRQMPKHNTHALGMTITNLGSLVIIAALWGLNTFRVAYAKTFSPGFRIPTMEVKNT